MNDPALAHMEELRDDAVDRLRLLRFTLTERIERMIDEIDATESTAAAVPYRSGLHGRLYAYREVLSLIGPEYDLTDDSDGPF